MMKITIEGSYKEGKSTMALFIANALSQRGIEVNVKDENLSPDVKFMMLKNFKSIMKDKTVIIETKNVRKEIE